MNSRQKDYVDAALASSMLGIKKSTLYSYVSRGLVRVSSSSGADPRSRLYQRADIEQLLDRKHQRRPAQAVERALDFGMPVLETRISRISAGALSYRGIDVRTLAAERTFEQVAALLWQAETTEIAFGFEPAAIPAGLDGAGAKVGNATDRSMRLLSSLLPRDESHLRARWLAKESGMLVGAIAAAAVGMARPLGEAMHVRLARYWRRPEAADALRQALILCADHELNASTFAVRVVASTGASLTASLIAGLAALSGPRHGGMTRAVAHLLDEVGTTRKARARVRARVELDGELPGFGHPLYPQGDPRGCALLQLVPRDLLIETICKMAFETAGSYPSLDVGLVALERGFALPRGSALALFTVGRTVGWIAHAIEQRETRQLIRPRARYVE